METMRALIAAACFVSVGISVAQSLIPENRFGKQMRIIFALLFIAAVAAPIAAGKVSFELPEISESTSAFLAVNSVEEDFKREIERNITEGLTEELENRGYFPEKISVSVNIEDEECISISNVSVLSEDNIGEITSEIKEILGEDINITEEKSNEELS